MHHHAENLHLSSFLNLSRSVSDFSHQSIEAVILCWAHLTTDPVRGKKYSTIQDSKWPAVAWRISLWQGARNVFWFQSSLSFVQKGFYCLQVSKSSRGKGHTASHMILYCMTYLPFGALYKKLYLVCREDYFSK